MTELTGKVAVVTGAARGIGRAAAIALAQAGGGRGRYRRRRSGQRRSRFRALHAQNGLIPGVIDTVLTRHEDRYAQAAEEGGKQPTGDEAKDKALAKQALLARTPLGVPWIDPNDVAPMVVFLASDAARMVSGGTYAVTGGDSAHGAA